MNGQKVPHRPEAGTAPEGAVFIGGGAARSRTGLYGFAIGAVRSAHTARTYEREPRAARPERLKRALLGEFFPIPAAGLHAPRESCSAQCRVRPAFSVCTSTTNGDCNGRP